MYLPVLMYLQQEAWVSYNTLCRAGELACAFGLDLAFAVLRNTSSADWLLSVGRCDEFMPVLLRSDAGNRASLNGREDLSCEIPAARNAAPAVLAAEAVVGVELPL